jgi:hypothetical protein
MEEHTMNNADPMIWDINDELREQRAKARETPEQRAMDSLRMQVRDAKKELTLLRAEVASLRALVMSAPRGPKVEYK